MMLTHLQRARRENRKLLAILIDPDKAREEQLRELANHAGAGRCDFFLWGGSLVSAPEAERLLGMLKRLSDVPVYLFPGSIYQLDNQADGLLLLSLISGRNPEMLIGRHVSVAARIKQMSVDVVPTGYMLVDGGRPTSVSYMSGTQPIPADKPAIAAATALAGELLGLRLIYLDAGSGAAQAVSAQTITAVRREVDLPIVVGGGIRTPELATRALKAGADMIVVGNGLEGDTRWLPELSAAVRSVNLPKKSISTRPA